MRFKVIGLDTTDLVIAGNRIMQPAALLQYDAAPVSGVQKPWIQSNGLVVVRDRFAATPEIIVGFRAAVIGDRVAHIERYGSVETLEGRLPLPEQLESEAKIAMDSRVARLHRDRPLEILYRQLQIVRLAREHAERSERSKMIGLDIEYFLVGLASGCDLPLLLQGLCSRKLLSGSCPGGTRWRDPLTHIETIALITTDLSAIVRTN
jgi:hypothetical protein